MNRQWSFYIAGVKFHELSKCINRLEVDDVLTLTPEPTNEYDPNAVRIEAFLADGGYMLGYVPKVLSAQVTAAIIAHEGSYTAKIDELTPGEKPWKQCKVSITIAED